MSEADTQGTSILLPESSVAVFSRDKDTLESFRTLDDDWRFTRVSLQSEEGDIATAISSYEEFESPDLVIIQTDNIDESFTEKLEELAGNCDEGTAAIVIGPVNDVYLYRKMIEMGISDYLVKPIEAPVMADVVAKTLIERLGVTGSRLIAFVGAKGGVGTSIVAQSAASGIADILDQKVMLMDACGGWSTQGVGLGFEATTTLAEAVRAASSQDEDSLKRMLHAVSDKLTVLASGGDVMLESTITAEQYEDLIDMLLMKYPIVLVDLSQAPELLKKSVIARANQIQLVTTQNLISLRQGRSLLQEIKEVRGGSDENIALVVNMQGQSKETEVAKGDIEAAMDFKVSAFLPFEPKIFQRNESQGQRVTQDRDGRSLIKSTLIPAVQDVLALSAQDDEEAEKSGKGGFFDNLFKKRSAK